MSTPDDAERLLKTMDDHDTYIAMLRGYKAKWLEAGFSEQTAEVLCVQYGQVVTSNVIASTQIKVATAQAAIAEAARAKR